MQHFAKASWSSPCCCLHQPKLHPPTWRKECAVAPQEYYHWCNCGDYYACDHFEASQQQSWTCHWSWHQGAEKKDKYIQQVQEQLMWWFLVLETFDIFGGLGLVYIWVQELLLQRIRAKRAFSQVATPVEHHLLVAPEFYHYSMVTCLISAWGILRPLAWELRSGLTRALRPQKWWAEWCIGASSVLILFHNAIHFLHLSYCTLPLLFP